MRVLTVKTISDVNLANIWAALGREGAPSETALPPKDFS
jgi:hypothetical protein